MSSSTVKTAISLSQVFTVDKAAFTERIGRVSKDRLGQILAGIRLLTEPRDIE